MVKETSTKLETRERDLNDLVGAIQATGATPQQYAQSLEYLRMVNSPDRSQQEQALEFMQREIATLARMLGKPVPGVNMLEGHDDLIHEVSTGRLPPERAQEIAAARAAALHQTRQGQLRRQQDTQAQRAVAGDGPCWLRGQARGARELAQAGVRQDPAERVGIDVQTRLRRPADACRPAPDAARCGSGAAEYAAARLATSRRGTPGAVEPA